MVKFCWIPIFLMMALSMPAAGLTQEKVMVIGEDGLWREIVRCATQTPSLVEMARNRDAVQRYRSARKDLRKIVDPIVIPIAVHVVRLTDGSADVSDKQIGEQMDVLNETFREYGFQFVLDSIGRVDNTRWSQHVAEDGSINEDLEIEMKEELAISPATTLNLYICNIGTLGYSTIPQKNHPEDDFRHGSVINYTTLPGGDGDLGAPYNEGDTAVHEIGHYLGLYHTFENGCDEPGDYVDDTPFEGVQTDGGCPEGKDTCPDLSGLDPIHNFMDYSDDACLNEFTEGQRKRMHEQVGAFRPSLLEIRRGLLAAGDVVVTDPGQNGAADPGETVELSIPLTNNGNTKINSVSATMTAHNQGVEIIQAKVDYPEIEAGGAVEAGETFAVAIDPVFNCSESFQVTLTATFEDDAQRSQLFDFTIPTGELITISEFVSPSLQIPDGDGVLNGVEEWAESTIIFSGTNATVKEEFNVDVDISHLLAFGLELILVSPEGISLKLQEFKTEGASDLIGNYPKTLKPVDSLNAFFGSPLDGAWTLRVGDITKDEVGVLNAWAIDNSYFQCEAATIQPGNINGRGGVNLSDAILGLKILAGAVGDSDTIELSAAIGQKEQIGLDDVIYILRRTAAR